MTSNDKDDYSYNWLSAKAEVAYGLKIVLTDETLGDIRKAVNANAKEKFEVAVEVDGKTKTYTLDDFLNRLGFSSDLDLTKIGSNDPNIYVV
jgi:hypothetical protein